jgi:3-dehydroquinate synthase
MLEGVRRKVRVDLAERSYDVHVGSGLVPKTGELASSLGDVGNVFVVTNPVVDALYGEAARASLDGVAGRVETIAIPDGEQYKSLDTLRTIYDRVLSYGADRRTIIAALGGGVVGDVAGFAAATVLRGIRLVMIPTTLLAQVDSSVGGKTAVNHDRGKNLIGAFHQPALVVSDTSTLTTLPEREYRAGLAEVIKYGVILDAELFALLETRAGDLVARDPELLTDIVARSVELKAQVVERDEREGGLRAILNFGHTVGHAIEKVTQYSRFLHGEAVAIGMSAAARVSRTIGACDAATAQRLERLTTALGLPTALPADLDRAAVEAAIGFDKKVRGDSVTFIVADGIGRCSRRPLSAAQIRAAL